MKKILVINGIQHTYTLITDSKGSRVVVTDAQGGQQTIEIVSYHVDPSEGVVIIITPTGSFVFHIAATTSSDGSHAWFVSQNPGVYTHHVHEHIVQSSSQSSSLVPSRRGSERYMTSPLAGRVSKVLVVVGQKITRGQVLLLIESMKMENELCAQGDAIVKTVFIQEADVVQLNQLLVEFEKEGDPHATPQNSDGT